MSYNREYVVNEEQVASFLADAVSRVENASESDIQALNEIKKLFKKNVPFSRRKYVAAYLVKQACGRGRFGHADRNDRFNRERGDRTERFSRERTERSERSFAPRDRSENREENHERAPRIQIDPSQATSIFIGIGRNRRVFPRDLVGLLVSVAGLDRERIGDIKVLANYSFIQLYTEDCEKAIQALNGYDYRGRTLSVSYSSRQKEDGVASDATSSEIAASENAVPQSEAGTAPADDYIPANVSNEGHAVAEENTATAQIAAEQSAFASQQASAASVPVQEEPVAPYSETTDDGQVKSHFGNGEAY